MLLLNDDTPKTIISDVDDIIFHTTALWYDRIIRNSRRLKDFIDVKQLFPVQHYKYENNFTFPLTRKEYYFKDWLLRKDLSESDKKKAENILTEIYLNNHFYKSNKLLPTGMLFTLKKLLSMKCYNIEKLVFVTRTYPETAEDKISIIRDYYADLIEKVDIIIVDVDEKKSDAVKEYESLSVPLILDDEFKNIKDYVMNNNFKDCMYLMPKLGYNSTLEIATEIENDPIKERLNKNNSQILHYDII